MTISVVPLLVAVATFLVLPGLLLLHLLFPKGELSWPKKLAGALPVSLGISIIPALVTQGLHLSLTHFGLLFVLVGIVLVALVVRRRLPHLEPHPGEEGATKRWLAMAFVLSLLGMVLLAYFAPRDNDDWTYLGWVRSYLDVESIGTQDPFLLGGAPTPPRYWVNNWLLMQSWLSRTSGVDPVEVGQTYLPPLLVAASLCAFYALAESLFRNRNVALLSGLILVGYSITDLAPLEGLGRGLLARIAQDKFLAAELILPVALFFMFELLTRPRDDSPGSSAKYLVIFALIVAQLAVIHPMGLVWLWIAFAPFALLHTALNRERGGRLAQLALPLLILTPIPIIEKLAMPGVEYGLPAEPRIPQGEGSGLLLSRLLTFPDGSYIANPNLISHPLILLALALTPLLLWGLRSSVASQFLLANMVIPLVLMYTPILTPLVGRIISPWMIWRLAWLLPTPLVLGLFLYRLPGAVGRLGPRARLSHRARWRWGALLSLVVVILVALLLRDHFGQSLAALKTERGRPPPKLSRFLRASRSFLEPGSIVIAPHRLNLYLPAFLDQAGVVTFRFSFLAEPSRLDDLREFFGSEFLTEGKRRIIESYGAGYVIVPAARAGLQTRLELTASSFRSLYKDEAFQLFQIAPERLGDRDGLVAAETSLASGETEEAIEAYRRALTTAPVDPLAYLGLAEALVQQENEEEAISAYEALAESIPQADWPHLRLAELYQQQGEVSKAKAHFLAAFKRKPDQEGAVYAAIGGYFLWQDQGGWHLRWGGSPFSRFTGSIEIAGGVMSVRGHSLEKDDTYTIEGSRISFTSQNKKGVDGLDFQATEGAQVSFDLSIDGRRQPKRVFLPMGMSQPREIPFTLSGLGRPD